MQTIEGPLDGKRKATQNLDEWLRAGELASTARRSESQAQVQVVGDLPSSSIKVADPSPAEILLAVGPAEVEVTREDAAS